MKYWNILFISLLSPFVFGQVKNSEFFIRQHITVLAADSMEGRLTGSVGELKAANYLGNQLNKFDIQPYLNDYVVPFEYKLNKNKHDTTSFNSTSVSGKNVIGYLDNKSQRTIVIGAHYDHLGRNEHGNSTAKNGTGEIHNGADDNASGVAAVLELARILSSNNKIENSNFIFAFFSGEEDGLMGSKAAANELSENFKIVTMINLDMVGRLDSLQNLHVGGIGTSPVFMKTLNMSNHFNFSLKTDSSGVGPSDNTSFYQKNIPVLFFYTGTHEDYHKPTDDIDKINFEGVMSILKYVHEISMQLSDLTEIPFTPTRNISVGKPRYKVTLGIMPDYSSSGSGLKIDHVIEEKAAFKGGVMDGDIIQKIDDCEITDVYSYMDCLSKLQPRQRISLHILRGEQFLELKIDL